MSQPIVLITTDMLRSELTSAELLAVPQVVLGLAEDNSEAVEAWLQERVLQACDRVVAAINTCERNRKITGGLCKVPAACVRTALVLARHAVLSAIPGMAETLEGSSRAAEYSTATRELDQLASCSLLPSYTLAEGEGATGGMTGWGIVYGEKISNWRF